MKTYSTKNSDQTQKLGETLAQELRGGEVICLSGELGAGKTTFTQGLLKGLKIKGPYTSPTFVIMKQYKINDQGSRINDQYRIQNIYHIDAYRVSDKDILDLGWEEILADKKNVIIVEWAEMIKKIIPACALWINFEWTGEEKRKIDFKSKYQNPNVKSSSKSK